MGAFVFSDTPLELDALRKNLLADGAGAYCSYEGWVRDKNLDKPVELLEYHGYPALAPAVGNKIMQEAMDQFDIVNASLAHRTGALVIGDIAVWVGVTATHRDAAFQACRYIVDEVKVRLPIWKKEIYTDGTTAWIQSRVAGTTQSPAPSE